MDSLTHTLLGACLGEAIAGKKMGKKAMLFGILANNLPDADMLTRLWNSEAHTLLSHRGITHSILFVLLATLGMTLLFERWFAKYHLTRREWLYLLGSGLILHILLDACTAYGTGWFEPFSSYRVSFNTLFILDPFFSLPMLIGTLFLLFLSSNRLMVRKIIYVSSLALSSAYLVLTVCIKLYVNSVIEKDLQAKQLPHRNFFTTPAPMNNLLWYSASSAGENFYTGYYSIFDKNKSVTWSGFQRHDSLLAPYKNNEDVQYLQQFSKGLYYINKTDSGIRFGDIRFGQLVGKDEPDGGFVFNFDIIPGPQGIQIKQSKFKDLNQKDIDLLLQRIIGNSTQSKD